MSLVTIAGAQQDQLKFGFKLGPARGPLPEFPYELSRGSFVFGSDLEQPLESLAELGERALQRLRPWIGRGQEPRLDRGPYLVFLCGDVGRIRVIEHAIGLPRMNPDQGEQVEFRGGFYSSAGMIAIPAKPGEDMRWDFLHELGHAVYSEFLLGYLISINEGIAEYSAERMIEAEPGAGALLHERRDWLLDQCRLAVAAGLPGIEEFVPLGHWQFLDEQVRDRNYALAWSLIRFLNRSQDRAVSERFGDFMQRMRRSTRPWRSFQETWDIATLEPLWHEYVEGIACWTSVYGDWIFRRDEISLEIGASGSAWTLWRKKPSPDESFRISFTLGSDLDPEIGIGFILGHLDWQDFVVIEVRSPRLLAITRRRAGRWQETWQIPVPIDRDDLAGQRLQLQCDPNGRVSLSLGGKVLASRDLGRAAHAGWFGLYAGRFSGPVGNQPAPVVFHLPTVSVDR